MASEAAANYKAAQAALIQALKEEFLADDLSLPASALGWEADQLVEFYESGGSTGAPEPAPAVAQADPAVAEATDASDGPDEALMVFVDDSGLGHLKAALAALSWDECDLLYKEGRPKLLSRLAKLEVKLSDRQKFVTVFGKATKPLVSGSSFPGGARKKAAEPFLLPCTTDVGSPVAEVRVDVKGYQEFALAAAIPSREAGLFTADDEAIGLLLTSGLKPFTKALPMPTADGGLALACVADGWASGDSATQHGMDLRMFINPGTEEQTLQAVVRFGDYAMIGRGFKGMTVHGGAIETCLDETTAELVKFKLYPMAATTSITFNIKKAVETQTTYLIKCEVVKEMIKNIKCEVTGKLTDMQGSLFADCTAVLVNGGQLANDNDKQQALLAARSAS